MTNHPHELWQKSKFGVYHTSNGRRLPVHTGATLPPEEQERRLKNIEAEDSDYEASGHHKPFAPNQDLIEGARSYNRNAGLADPHEHGYDHIRTNSDNLRSIGRAYQNLPNHDPKALPSFEHMGHEVSQQYDHLTGRMGIKVHPVDYDPYKDVHEMVHDVRNNKQLKVLKTAVTGGHPFFSDDQNDKFRAVHDAFGHAATGRGFDAHGEEAAFAAHSRMFSHHARPAMTSETRGQNAYLHLNGEFGDQKIALLPHHMQEMATDLRPYRHTGSYDNLQPEDPSVHEWHATEGRPWEPQSTKGQSGPREEMVPSRPAAPVDRRQLYGNPGRWPYRDLKPGQSVEHFQPDLTNTYLSTKGSGHWVGGSYYAHVDSPWGITYGNTTSGNMRVTAADWDEYRRHQDAQQRRFERPGIAGGQEEHDQYFGKGEYAGSGVEKKVTPKEWMQYSRQPTFDDLPAHEQEWQHGRELGESHGQNADRADFGEMDRAHAQSSHPDHFYNGYVDGLNSTMENSRVAVFLGWAGPGYVHLARKLAEDMPKIVRLAHDSGDSETIFHCPFCGSGQVLARNDGTVECQFCQACFTVQVQPQYPAFPQTVNGVPVNVPGMGPQWPGEDNTQPDAGMPVPGDDDQDADGVPDDQEEPADADGEDEDTDGGNPNPFAKASMLYRTAQGAWLDEQQYMRHLALTYTRDRQSVLKRIRQENESGK
jgi:hypothetical protein